MPSHDRVGIVPLRAFGQGLGRMIRLAHSRAVSRWVSASSSQSFEVTPARTMVFAPHPDDETLGCGGLIARKRARGIDVQVVFVSDGAESNNVNFPRGSTELVQSRQADALRALATLGVAPGSAHFLDHPDGKLAQLPTMAREQLQRDIRSLIQVHSPTEVFVTHRRDGHSDHEETYRQVVTAVAESGQAIDLIQYSIWMGWLVPLLFQLRPSHLAGACRLNIEAVREIKTRAMEAYSSQIRQFPPGFIELFNGSQEFFFRSP